MLDIKFIRENKDLIKDAAKRKKVVLDVDRLLSLDIKRRSLISEIDALRYEHKISSEKIITLSGEKREKFTEQLRDEKNNLVHKEYDLRAVETEYNELMLLVPNFLDPTVPDGESDADNKEIRAWGEIPDFKKIGGRTYLEIMEDLDMVDLERGVKVSGFRGYFLKNEAAKLSLALWQFCLDFLAKKGFVPMIAPSIVKKDNLIGTGWFPQAEEDVYKTQDETYLAGTAEVAVMGYHKDEILSKNDLPKKYVAFSPCFRREAGSYGKDQKGLFRVHEFFKIEQIILCRADHQESVRFHEELTANSEEIMQLLKIPYRVVINCAGDLGLGQVKKYDIEAWIPSEGKYRETHSSSYFHDFQTRRLNIRYKDEEEKIKFAHSLNNTAIATPRVLEALLENHQKPEGKFEIPEVLKKYM
ncbi:MAG: serine--tRNA ligase [Patescibacteria group bacterium]